MLASQSRFGDAAEAFGRAVELGGVPEAEERLHWIEEDLEREQLHGPD